MRSATDPVARVAFDLDALDGAPDEQRRRHEQGGRDDEEEQTEAAHRSPREAVTFAAHGLERAAFGHAELLAELGDVHVDGARVDVLDVAHAPDLEQQRPAADDPSAIAREERQHAHLARRQLDAAASVGRGSARAGSIVQPASANGPVSDGASRPERRSSASMRAISSADRERLRHVVVRAAAKALEHVAFGAASREHEDAELRPLGAELAADLEAGETGQHDVEHDERVASPERSAQALLARADAVGA